MSIEILALALFISVFAVSHLVSVFISTRRFNEQSERINELHNYISQVDYRVNLIEAGTPARQEFTMAGKRKRDKIVGADGELL